jgi:hypothetical protein
MKNRVLYISLILALFTLSGCGTLTKSKVFAPNNVQLNLGMDDLEYLGEVKIDMTYRTYLGFIKVIDTVNDEEYDRTNSKEVCLYSQFGVYPLSADINKAAYKLVEKYPDATYFQPILLTKVKDRLFLGSKNKIEAVVKAYKFK